MRRAVAIIYAVPGVGWLVSTLLVLLYLDRRGELPMTPFGFRLLGGPYPRIGTERLTPLGWALAWLLVAVSALDALVGRWLWQGHRRGAVLALALAPVSLALGRLFALPFLIIAVPVRVVLVLLSWRELGRPTSGRSQVTAQHPRRAVRTRQPLTEAAVTFLANSCATSGAERFVKGCLVLRPEASQS